MTNLSGEKIGVLIYANKNWGPGGNKDAVIKFLDTAIAVALAESSGNPRAVNGTHYGLFQIGKDSHPELFRNHNWADPADNIDMARIVWNNAGKSWSPWQTYTSGAYRQYLGHGKKVYEMIDPLVAKGDSKGIRQLITDAALQIMPGGAALTTLPGDPLGSFGGKVSGAVADATGANKIAQVVAGALKDTFTWLSGAFLTVGAGLLAIVLLILGIWFIVSNTKTGQQIGSAAKDTATKAAMAAAL